MSIHDAVAAAAAALHAQNDRSYSKRLVITNELKQRLISKYGTQRNQNQNNREELLGKNTLAR